MPSPTSRVLVGREAELGRLIALLGDGDEEVTALLLAGDAGVGKTRLLMELRDLAQAQGWQVLAGHCLDFGESALPYLPFTEVVGRVAALEADLLARVAAEHPAITRLQPGRRTRGGGERDADPGSDVGPTTDRADLFAAVHALMESLAAAAPVLLVIEDAHWADRSTRDMLGFLFSRGFAGRVQLVVSYRSDDLHRRHPMRRQVAEWARLPGLERMQLPPLPETAVRALVSALVPDGLDEEQMRRIVDRADGNAFFVEELVATREELVGGHLPDDLPDDLADLLLVRIDPLGDAARAAVRSMCVAGRRVTHDQLAAVVDLAPDVLDAGIREAVERNVIEAGPRHYSFRHALLAEAVYDDLLPGERVRLHARFVAALSEGRASGTAAELARHARRATDLDRATTASIEAGDEALAVGGPDEAAGHYASALELLADPERATRLDVDLSKVAIKAADALGLSGATQRAAELLAAHLDRLPVGPVGSEAAFARARLLSQYAGWLTMIETDRDPVELAREAAALAPETPGPLRAKVLAAFARVLSWRGLADEAGAAATEALALAERLAMPALASEVATTLGLVAGQGQGAGEGAVRAALQAAVERADAADAPFASLRARYQLARSYQDEALWEQAAQWFGSAIELGARAGLPWAPYSLESRWQLALIRFCQGDWDEALALVEGGTGAPTIGAAILAPVRLEILAARGDDVDAELRRLRRLWSDEGVIAIYSAGVEISVAAARADAQAAIEAYDAITAMLRVQWSEHFGARVRLAALAVGAIGRAVGGATAEERSSMVGEAERLVADGEAVREHHLSAGRAWGAEGEAWSLLLRAEAARVRWLADIDPPDRSDLVDAWAAVVSAFETIGHVPWLARSRASYAGVLGECGDASAAETQRDLARPVAERLGDRWLSQALGGASRRAPSPTAVAGEPAQLRLTAREREILGLVAEGRSNGEIGRVLFISTKTVSVHVSNILAKLGAASRTEAAAIARRDGLLTD